MEIKDTEKNGGMCVHGHPKTPDNMNKQGECRTCVRAYMRRNAERRKQERQERRQLGKVERVARRRKAFCKWGHRRTEDNIGADGRCLVCRNIANAEVRRIRKINKKRRREGEPPLRVCMENLLITMPFVSYQENSPFFFPEESISDS